MTLVATRVRNAEPRDLDGIVEVDARIGGEAKPAWWARILDAYRGQRVGGVALVAVDEHDQVLGYLFGEVRAWEFGSDRCGWIFAVAVHPDHARGGVATALCRLATHRFRQMGVDVVRTMVRRDAVPVLSFFRSMGFVGGPFSEMEKRLDVATPTEGPR